LKILRFLFLITLGTQIAICQDVNTLDTGKLGWWVKKNTDTQPSVDIEGAYNYIQSKGLKARAVTTIAILDTDIDIEHKDLANNIWKNNNETPNNQLDNDKNGYVNDVYGWNFIGNKIDGTSLDYTLMEETRILRKYTKEELNKLYSKKKILYTYEQVKQSYDDIVVSLKNKIKPYEDAEAGYVWAMDTLKNTFNKESFTIDELNNLTSKDTIVQQSIDYVKALYNDGYEYEKFMTYLDFKRKSLEVCMNLEYDNRELIGDDISNYKDNQYGSPYIAKNVSNIDHGTKVAGVLGLLYNKLNELSDKKHFYIMPLVITGIGDPTDKDTALAIRYAVDNGAKVINVSQTKSFSINDKLVDKALSYAEKKDVLIIKSAGNEGIHLDENIRFPNDTNHKGEEIVDNVIIVGAVTKVSQRSKKSVLYKNSSYGKNNVDIYAPGSRINTLIPDNKYKRSSGTSYAAPIVTGIASLIRSYFPSLTAREVKQILMDSGTPYDVEVEFEEEKKRILFSELSKSGKVINAYNALLMAEKVVNGKPFYSK